MRWRCSRGPRGRCQTGPVSNYSSLALTTTMTKHNESAADGRQQKQRGKNEQRKSFLRLCRRFRHSRKQHDSVLYKPVICHDASDIFSENHFKVGT